MISHYSTLPLLAVLLSLFAPLPLALVGREQDRRESFTFLVAFLKLAIVLAMLPTVLWNGDVFEMLLFQVAEGVSVAFKVDGFGILFALVASSLWIVTSVYSMGYMRTLKEHSQTRYYCFFALSLSATLGVAFSANLLTMYLFYEMLSLSTYPLVTHHQDQEARSAGRKYLTYILGTSIGLVLPAMLIIYFLTGTLEFRPDGIMANADISNVGIGLLCLMFVFGFAKAGMMPFHSWLPGAMVAPTPVSSLLHAVAVVKVGVFCIIRVVTGIFGTDLLALTDYGFADFSTIACVIISVTVLLSSLIALTQDNLKRRLAFSTIGQLGYIVLGVLLLSPKAVMGAAAHIPMHAFSKITLFFVAGAIFVATGKKYVSQLDGLGRKMPFTFAAFFIGSMGVVGIPPACGFMSKWYLLQGSYAAGNVWAMVTYLLSSLLGAAYLFPIAYRGFFKPLPEGEESEGISEAPLLCVLPLLFTAFMTFVLFFYSEFVFKLASSLVP